ncbi:MAG: hypothetical protein FGM33_10360 [Candidatus Kapabacteria bacterium]|nr:hypothetical protein [Candidatus Kapabacteria bacterium]
MGSDKPSSKMRRWWRIIIALAVVASVVYLTLFIRGLLFEARMSLGIIRQSQQGILAQIVNKEQYVPPADGILRPSQIMSLHEIAREVDSLARTKADQRMIESKLVVLLNRYTMSAGEYRWVRSTALRYAGSDRGRIRTVADSVNSKRLRMIATDLSNYTRFFRDTLDAALTK